GERVANCFHEFLFLTIKGVGKFFSREHDPIYKGEPSLDYIICVCSSNYCNNVTQPGFVELETPLSDDKILQLTEEQDREQLRDDDGTGKLIPKSSSHQQHSSSLFNALCFIFYCSYKLCHFNNITY
uniref:Uncharacterized protein n=1 Tax=Parascaris equorum TaxID=6256 RepID=A0A914RIE5_PAREQ